MKDVDKISDKVLNDAKALLVKLCADWGKGERGVTLGRAISMKGEVTHGVNYNQCHAWLTSAFHSYNAKKDKNFLILSCHSKLRSKGICSEEAHEAIILWLASDECPFSQYILNRDDKDSLLNGGIILLCGPDGITNSNHAMWLCKVLRYGVEGSKALDVWHTLYKGGVNPLLALFVATYIRTVQGATFGWTGAEGHSAVFSGGYWGAYKRGAHAVDLLEGVINPKAQNTTEVFSKPGRVNNDRVPDKEQEIVKGFCKPIKKSDGWGGTVEGKGADAEDFVARVLKWEEELRRSLQPPAPPPLPDETTVYLDLDM
jgi:hypothetical protein